MTRFDNYRWEDHTPRPGRWKFDLVMTLLAVGLLLTSLPDTSRFDFPTFSAGIDQERQNVPEPAIDLRRTVVLERAGKAEQRPSCPAIPAFMRTAASDEALPAAAGQAQPGSLSC
jgi:hypothetical protein